MSLELDWKALSVQLMEMSAVAERQEESKLAQERTDVLFKEQEEILRAIGGLILPALPVGTSIAEIAARVKELGIFAEDIRREWSDEYDSKWARPYLVGEGVEFSLLHGSGLQGYWKGVPSLEGMLYPERLELKDDRERDLMRLGHARYRWFITSKEELGNYLRRARPTDLEFFTVMHGIPCWQQAFRYRLDKEAREKNARAKAEVEAQEKAVRENPPPSYEHAARIYALSDPKRLETQSARCAVTPAPNLEEERLKVVAAATTAYALVSIATSLHKIAWRPETDPVPSLHIGGNLDALDLFGPGEPGDAANGGDYDE